MAFRGLLFSQAHEHLDVFAVDLHETGPSGGDVHWRGAAAGHEPGELRGADQDQPGRAAEPHLPAVPLDAALRHRQARRDPLGARQRRRRLGLPRRHRRRARRARDLLHAVARPLPPAGGPGDRRGLLRAADRPARRPAARAGDPRRASAPSSPRPPTTSSATRSPGEWRRASVDRTRRPRRLPDPRPRDRRPPARLPRLLLDLAEARARARRARRLLPQPQREHPPRRLRAGAGGRRAVRGRARADRGVPQLADGDRRSSPAT